MSKFTIDEKVLRFTSAYNSTPSSVTKDSPYDRIFSYKVRNVANSLNPRYGSVNNRLKEQHVTVNVGNKRHSPVREVPKYCKGEEVLYRNHFKSYIKWLPAVVVGQRSPVVYVIKLRGQVRTAHVNQLRYPSKHSTMYYDKYGKILTETNKALERPGGEDEVEILSPRGLLRRSERTRKAPDRFTF